MKRSIKFLTLLVLAWWTGSSAWAEDHYLVGGCTASGWNAGDEVRSPVAMVNVSDGIWVWSGKLTVGEGDDGRFKIPNSASGWDGYWAPEQGTVLTSDWSDLSTNGDGDKKYCVAEEGIYRITINTSSLKIKAEKLTEPSKDGDYYQIATVDDYYWYAGAVTSGENTLKARLTADLDFSAVGFFPLACDKFKYQGEFDGNGHVMDNMVIIGSNNNVALIRYATDGANVSNLVIGEHSSFTGSAKIGGVIGFARDNGTVTLTGVVNKATVKSTGTTDANAAGLVGCATDGTAIVALNCANMGAVSGQDGQCAAFAGWTQVGTSFTNCWNSGAISNIDGSSQLYRNSGSVTAVNCFDATSVGSQGTKVAAAEVASGELCYKLNGNKSTDVAWYQNLGVDADANPYPFGTDIVYANGNLKCDGLTPKEGSEVAFSNTEGSNVDEHTWGEWGFCTVCDEIQPDYVALEDGYYLIANAKQLNWVAVWTDRKDASVKVKLTQDIDMSEVGNFPGLGSDARRFTGELDGQRHILSNLNMDWTDRNEGVGLVNRAASGARVKNVTIASNCSFKGKKGVGGIIGALYGGGDVYIENCGNEGSVESTGQNAGGIVGVCFNDTKLHLTNVYNVGTVRGADAGESGSLSGWMSNAIIENCYSVAGYPSAEDTYGFQQGNQFARGNDIQLTNCYDFGTGDWGTNGSTWASAFADGRKISDPDNETEMSRVFAGLFDGNGGNVWRMEYKSGWAHPVLYDTDLVLKENNYNRFVAEDDADLTLVRTTVAGTWNTICLPFSLSAAQVAEVFGTGAQLAEFSQADGETMKFVTSSVVEAGKPYLVQPTTAIESIGLTGVSIASGAASPVANGNFTFAGVYEPTQIAQGDYFVAAGNKLTPSNGEGSLKAFRAYFQVAGGAKASAFTIDDVATGIVNADGTVEGFGDVYTLSGVRVEKPVRGLYIVNGKKIVIK